MKPYHTSLATAVPFLKNVALFAFTAQKQPIMREILSTL